MLVGLLVSGCETIRYEYKPPSSDAGKQCAVQCLSIREGCYANESQKNQAAYGLCLQEAELSYRTCMDTASSKEQQEQCAKKKKVCYESSYSSGRCDEGYRQCYTTCGGSVLTIVEKH